MNTNDDRFAQAKTFNDLDMRMNEFPFETVTDWAGNTVSLYVNDYELQRKVCITKNAKLKDVVFYYMNGDITVEQFDRYIYMEQHNRYNYGKTDHMPWFYRPVIFIVKIIISVMKLILFLEDRL